MKLTTVGSNDAPSREQFKARVADIKQHARERSDEVRPTRPAVLNNFLYDVDWDCYRWVGHENDDRVYFSMAPLTEGEFQRLRAIEIEYQCELAHHACSTKNRIITDLEHLVYDTLDTIPQYQAMGRKISAIQTILETE